MSHDQSFRSDLYFRISTIRLVMPPLRKRVEDIPVLAETFLRAIVRDLGHPQVRLTDGAMLALQRYSWPGNVRELRNVIARRAAHLRDRAVDREPWIRRGAANAPAIIRAR